MKYAVMSDAHANPVALQSAIADAEKKGCGKFLFLGDATGYGYDANETIRIIRERFDVSLMGNHDAVACGLDRSRFAGENPHYAVDRAQSRELSRGDRAWLRSRPFMDASPGFALAHGDFVDPGDFAYVETARDAAYNFRYAPHRLMFCGHLHHAVVWSCRERRTKNGVEYVVGAPYDAPFDDRLKRRRAKTVRLRDNIRYIVNVGSVGYPRNDGHANYAIYDDTENTVAIRALPFDYAAYVDGMKRRGYAVPVWIPSAI